MVLNPHEIPEAIGQAGKSVVSSLEMYDDDRGIGMQHLQSVP